MRMVSRSRQLSTSSLLLANNSSPIEVKAKAVPLSLPNESGAGLSRSDMFTAFYPLDAHETRKMVEWLSHGGSDVRFRLRTILNSSAFDEYDVVLIDYPPRFSTGTINALCASTHLIIPSVLDMLSAEAVIYFTTQIKELKAEVFPGLQVLGVLPNMVYKSDGFTQQEDRIAERIDSEIRRILGADQWVIRGAALQRSAAISKAAGEGGPFLFGRAAHSAFEKTGKAISKRLL